MTRKYIFCFVSITGITFVLYTPTIYYQNRDLIYEKIHFFSNKNAFKVQVQVFELQINYNILYAFSEVSKIGNCTEDLIKTYPAANRTTARIFALVSRLLHTGRDQAVRAEQMPLQTLVGEEAELALLAVERRSVVDHLRMYLDLVYPLHVVAQLLQVLDVAVADLADDERVLGRMVARLRKAHRGGGAAAGQRGDRDARLGLLLVTLLLLLSFTEICPC